MIQTDLIQTERAVYRDGRRTTHFEAEVCIHVPDKLRTAICLHTNRLTITYRGADKSLARPTSRCILFDGENISFDANLVIYINSTNIPPIMIINRIH